MTGAAVFSSDCHEYEITLKNILVHPYISAHPFVFALHNSDMLRVASTEPKLAVFNNDKRHNNNNNLHNHNNYHHNNYHHKYDNSDRLSTTSFR